MRLRSLVSDSSARRALLLSAVAATAFALAGCNGENASINAKAMKPIPEKLVAEMQKKDMDVQSPMLVRLFKQEAELEVWKQTREGKYELLKTYPICRWSGDLGPKIKEGDRQAPEGFYSITPAQMNPQSAYYLSFNMGYPNAFDRSLGRTGSQLMVHGDCSSRGCYAMTDEQISEIYSIGRESFFGGQRAFQVQAYPFRMTPQNMAKHRNNPNMPFWKMIKEGYDHFEVTRQEPKVDVCEQRYVFDAEPPPGATRPLAFSAAGKCPAYQIPAEVADAVRAKQQRDDQQTAELISRGTPTVAMKQGIDGGMNAVFASKIPEGHTGLSDPAPSSVSLAAYSRAPGTIPGTVNPPRPPQISQPAAFAFTPDDTSATTSSTPTPTTQVAAASSGGSSATSFFTSLASRVGLGGSDETTAPTPPRAVESKPTPAPRPRVAARPASKPAPAHPVPRQATAVAEPPRPAASSTATLSGGQPIVSSNSFDSRWSTVR